MSSEAVVASTNPERWLFGRGPDLMIGCGLGYILSIPLLFYFSEVTETTQWPAFLVMAMGLLISGPHYGATITRVYENREDRSKYVVFAVYITIALALVTVASVRNVWLASFVTTVYFTWSPWHFAGQNYGLMIMFLRRRGVDVDSTAKRLIRASFVFSAALAIISVHAGNKDLVFAPSTLPVANSPAIMYLPIPSGLLEVIVPVALLAYIGCLGGVAWRLRHRVRLRDAAPALVLVLTQALWFTIPAILILWKGNRTNTLMFAAVWISTAHAIQYLWVTAHYAKSSGSGTSLSGFFLKSFAAGTAVTALPAILLAPHLLGGFPLDVGLATVVFSMVNIHHFILDGAIWKLRDGRVARVLLRTAVPPGLAEPIVPPPHRAWVRTMVWSIAGLAVASRGVMFFATNVANTTDQMDRIESAMQALRWVGHEKVEGRYQFGRRLAATGDHARAIEEFRRSIELFPTGRVWAALGVEYKIEGRLEEALAAFESALELNPAFWGAHYQRAEVLLATVSATNETEVREIAMASLQQALDLSPGFARATRLLARLQVESGRSDQAILTLERGLERADPANAPWFRNRLTELKRTDASGKPVN